MEQIRDISRDMIKAKRSEWQQASAEASEAAHIRNVVFGWAVAVNLVFLLWVYRRINKEISRRERAVQETFRQRDILATTLASIGDAVLLADAQTRIVFMNKGGRRADRMECRGSQGHALRQRISYSE